MSLTSPNGDLFGRTFELTLSKPFAGPSGYFGVGQTNGVIIRNPMRVNFKIERSLEKTPNTCTIEIYNLAPLSRSQFTTMPLRVRIDAGYPKTFARLFEGDLITGYSKREGPNWITSLTVGDGTRAYANARVNKTFGAGTNPKDAIAHAAAQMGLRMPKNVKDAKDLVGQLVSGNSLRGRASDAMTSNTKPYGYGWSVQDGTLQILRDDQVAAGQAYLISQATGMLESPSIDPPKKPGDKPTLHVKTLLYPGLFPGCQIKLESRSINGQFRVTKVNDTGDSRDKDWYTQLEATPV